MAIKSLSIRIDSDMLNRLHYVADYEGRSANSQILILIRDAIEKFENDHGKIELNKPQS
ncbi:MAG: Arc family DNA-binding protein [Clostridiales bacterium]|nr:Arc family DNA-binding protein [Clostridiales bacterium]